jgi:hypothetical protein
MAELLTAAISTDIVNARTANLKHRRRSKLDVSTNKQS